MLNSTLLNLLCNFIEIKLRQLSFPKNAFGQLLLPLIPSDKINLRNFYTTKCFIDDLCTVNEGGEFGKPIYDIYSKEL